jgi:hypothetical protein
MMGLSTVKRLLNANERRMAASRQRTSMYGRRWQGKINAAGMEEKLTLVSQRVGVRPFLPEDHQVLNVDVSDSDALSAEEGGSGDGLERDFDTERGDDDVGVDALVGGVSLPDGSSGHAAGKDETDQMSRKS